MRLLKYLIIHVFIGFSAISFGQTTEWWLSTSSPDEVATYAVDYNETHDLVFVGGTYAGSTSMYVSSTEDVLSAGNSFSNSNAGSNDGFATAIDNSGSVVWSAQVQSTGFDAVTSVASTSNNVCFGGYFSGTLDFINSGGITINAGVTASDQDIFFVSFNEFGQLLWYNTIVQSGQDRVMDIVTDGTDYYALVVKQVAGTFDPDDVENSANLLEIIRVNGSNGSYSTINTFTSSESVLNFDNDFSTKKFSLDYHEGKIYVVGTFSGASLYVYQGSDFSSDIGAVGSTDASEDLFYASVNLDGTLNWIQPILSAQDTMRGFTIEATCDAVYLALSCEWDYWPNLIVIPSANFGVGRWIFRQNNSADQFEEDPLIIAKCRLSDGKEESVWLLRIPGEIDKDHHFALESDANGNVYIGGETTKGSNDGTVTLFDNEGQGCFLTKLGSDGNFEWTHTYDGEERDVILDIAVKDEDEIFVGGISSTNFMGESTVTTANNAFVMKIQTPASGAELCCSSDDPAGDLEASNSVVCTGDEVTFTYLGTYDPVYLEFSNDGTNWNDVTTFSDTHQLFPTESGEYRVRVGDGSCPEHYTNKVEINLSSDATLGRPGNVSCGLSLWLRADSLVRNGADEYPEEGDYTQYWNDLSQNDFEFYPLSHNGWIVNSRSPQFDRGGVNFNDALRFDGSDNMIPISKFPESVNDGMTLFMVLKPDSVYDSEPMFAFDLGEYPDDGFGIQYDKTKISANLPGIGASSEIVHGKGQQQVILRTELRFEKDVTLQLDDETPLIFEEGDFITELTENTVNYNETYNNNQNDGGPLVIGMKAVEDDDESGFSGHIAEIITYDRILSDEENKRIQSYLAIRYGIAPEFAETEALVNSSGDVIFDAAGDMNGYTNDIAGIGYDENSSLVQKKSQTAQGDPVIMRYIADGFAQDQSYLIWGSDGGDHLSRTSSYNGVDNVRADRVYRVQETGSVGEVELYVGRITLLDYNYVIVNSTDPTFSSVDRIYCLEELAGFSMATIDFQDGDYFSFLKADPQATVTNVNCLADNTGEIDLLPFVEDYDNLVWSPTPPSGTIENPTGLTGGIYTLTYTTPTCTQSFDFEITEPTDGFTIDDSQVQNVSCFGAADGSINIDITSTAMDAITYNWDHDATATNPVEDLGPGTYNVEIGNGSTCTVNLSFEITEPSPLEGNVLVIEPTCFGFSDGSISVSPSGGTTPYTPILWSTGDNDNSINVSAATYTVEFDDAEGCHFEETITVGQPEELTISQNVANDNQCFNVVENNSVVTTAGGNPPRSVTWSDGSIGPSLVNAPVGTYFATVTDDNGCTAVSADFVITSPSEISIDSSDITNVSCNGDSNGEIDIEVSGGAGGYVYAWDNPSTSTSQDLSGLEAGTFSVTITDSNSCEYVASFDVTEPNLLTYSSSVSNITCNGDSDGAISVIPQGGAAPHTILWNDGNTDFVRSGLNVGTYSFTLTDDNSCEVFGSFNISQPDVFSFSSSVSSNLCNAGANGSISLTTTYTGSITYNWTPNIYSGPSLTNLPAGTYQLEAINAAGCVFNDSYEITEPTELVVTENTVAHQNVSCFGLLDGSMTVNVTGGAGGYNYLWVDESMDIVGTNNSTLENVGVGTYTVTVTDANLCSESLSIEITEPIELEISINYHNDPTCFGALDGAMEIEPSGGVEPYWIGWINTDSWTDLGVNSPSISGLAEGNYKVTVVDDNGCTEEYYFFMDAPNEITIGGNITDASCNGESDGSIDVWVNDAQGAINYLWSPNGETTEDLSDVEAGTYTLTVEDIAGCTVTSSPFEVGEPASNLIVSNELISNISCAGMNDGSITVWVNGNVGTLSYSLSPNAGEFDGGFTFYELPPDNYQLTITDSAEPGCPLILDYTLSEPNELFVSISTSDNYCQADLDGTAQISITGGTPFFNVSYDYTDWEGTTINTTIGTSLPAGTIDLTNLGSGDYQLNITESNGCSSIENFEIEFDDLIGPTSNPFFYDHGETAVDENCQYVFPNFINEFTFNDLCGVELVEQNPSEGSVSSNWSSELDNPNDLVVFQGSVDAYDFNGNLTESPVIYLFKDLTPPSFGSTPAEIVLSGNADCEAQLPSDLMDMIEFVENCNLVNTSVSHTAGQWVTDGEQILVTASDPNATSEHYINIVVQDGIDPTLNNLGAPTTVFVDNSCEYLMPNLALEGFFTFADNCALGDTIQSPAPGTVLTTGVVPVSMEIQDAGGLSAVESYFLSIEDNQTPVLNVAPFTFEVNDNCEFILGDLQTHPNVEIIDNCPTTYTQIVSAPNPLTVGVYNVSIQVEDDFQDVTQTTTIEVVDLILPEITCPNDQVRFVDDNCEYLIEDFSGDLVYSDNCTAEGDLTISASFELNDDVLNVGSVNTISYTVLDESGNAQTCSFNIDVQDNLGPVIIGDPEITVIAGENCQYELEDLTGLFSGSYDGCGGDITISQSISSGFWAPGTYEDLFVITAVDEASNFSNLNIDLIVLPNETPIIECDQPSVFVEALVNCEATVPNLSSFVDFSHICNPSTDPIFHQSVNEGDLISTNTSVNVWYEHFEGSSQSEICTIELVLMDNEDPVINCPTLIEVNANTSCEYVMEEYSSFSGADLITISDNCEFDYASQSIEPVDSVLIPGVYDLEVMAYDTAGNSAACNVEFSVLDITIPTIDCPTETIEVDAGAGCVFNIDDFDFSLITVNDVCGGDLTFGSTLPEGSTFDSNTSFSFPIYAADEFNNISDICTFTVFVNVSDAPYIDCVDDLTIAADENCSAVIPDANMLATASSSCSGDTDFTLTTEVGNFYSDTTLVVTVEDSFGLTNSCAVNLILEDVQPPTFGCLENQIRFADASCEYHVEDFTSLITDAQDACDSGSLTSWQSIAEGSVMGITSSQEITIYFQDISGNIDSCSFNLSVQDNTAPIILCPDTIQRYANSACEYLLEDLSSEVDVTENCEGLAGFGQTHNQLDDLWEPGIYEVYFDATDWGWNPALRCTTHVVVNPGNSLSLDCDQTFNVPINAMCEGLFPDVADFLTADSECSNAAIEFSQSIAIDSLVSTGGIVSVTVTDGYSVPFTCSSIVYTVDDIDGPIMECISDTTFNAIDGECYFTGEDFCGSDYVVMSDCSGIDFDFTYSDVSTTDLLNVGSHIVTVYGQDIIDGNPISQCTINVTVIDGEDPYIVNCPDSIGYEMSVPDTDSGTCEFLLPDLSLEYPLEDLCDTELDYTQTPTPGTVYFDANTTGIPVTFTAFDEGGNNTSCNTLIHIIDVNPPVFVECPTSIELSTNTCEAIVGDLTDQIEVQDCSITGTPITQSLANDEIIGLGNTPVTFIASDMYGNIDSCVTTINVTDISIPAIQCPNDETLNVDECFALTPDYSGIEVIDNCGSQTILQSIPVGTELSAGTHEMMITTNDGNNNVDTCYFNIEVIDTTDPILVCPESAVIDSQEGICGAIFDYDAILVEGECSDLEIVQTAGYLSGETLPVETEVEFSFEATDAAGNIGECSFTVYVEDVMPPEFINCSDTLIFCTSEVVFENLLATDLCGEVTIDQTDATGYSNGDMFPIGTTNIEFTAMDLHNNTATCETAIIVIEPLNADWAQIPEEYCINWDALNLLDFVETDFEYSWSDNIGSTGLFNPSMYNDGEIVEITLTVNDMGCVADSSQNIQVIGLPQLIVESPVEVCGLEADLEVETDALDVLWTSPDGVVFDPDDVAFTSGLVSAYGEYTAEVTTSTLDGCISSDEVTVIYYEQPTLPNAGSDIDLFVDTSTNLNGSYSGAGEAVWSSNDEWIVIENPEELDTYIESLEEGENVMVLTAMNGVCPSISDSVNVNVVSLFIPTGFSPNGDGVNDELVINGVDKYETKDLKVFNRWGEIVFEQADYDNTWNGISNKGNNLPADTYFIILELDENDYQGYVIIKRE